MRDVRKAGSEGAILWPAAVAAVTLSLTALAWSGTLPAGDWWGAAFGPDLDRPGDLAFHFAALPRAVVAIAAGAGLGVAGLLLQQSLANPLASPTTLGLEAGAQLALTCAIVLAPTLVAHKVPVALAGAAVVLGFVMLCAIRARFASLTLLLAGLSAGLFCSAFSVALRLLNQEYVPVLFLWGGGRLDQEDWGTAAWLPVLVAAVVLAATLMTRPFALLSLGEDARSLGLPVSAMRGIGVALAAIATACVTAHVGVIGFVGLAAPHLARLSCFRPYGQLVLATAGFGAALLLSVDAAVVLLRQWTGAELPTGAATAVFGAPLLVWLMARRRQPEPTRSNPTPEPGLRERPASFPALVSLLALALAGSVLVGRDAGQGVLQGWTFANLGSLEELIPWRFPRAMAAGCAGALLAMSGVLLQRLTGNPLAAPEVLGVGAGVAFGMVASMIVLPQPQPGVLTVAGSAGAFGVLLLILATGGRRGFLPDRLLLIGLAVSALLDAVVVGFLALGDPRASTLLAWLSGSTYAANWSEVAWSGAMLAVCMPLALTLVRWLDILPLGGATALGLGLQPERARLAVLLLAAGATASAVLVAGPLTFVGLAGPHMASRLGARDISAKLVAAALLGAVLMIVADILSRTVIAPRQVPAGLVAALIGLPYLVWRLASERQKE